GKPDTAIERVALAMRLSPLDPLMFVWQVFVALAHFCARRYDEAASWATKSLRGQPDYPAALRVSTASNALAGRLDKAQRVMARLRELDPGLRVSNLEDVLLPRWRPKDRNRYVGALVKAGLPE